MAKKPAPAPTPARRSERAAPASPQGRAAAPPPPANDTPKTAIATAKQNLPAELMEMFAKDSGQGLSKDASDNLVPLIYVLQDLSPQVKTRETSYVEGALPGMIYLKSDADPLKDGESEGIVVQPCHFEKVWIEWIPRDSGGGFVARHATRPHEATERASDPKNPNKKKWTMPNGNEVIETRQHVVVVHMEDGRRVPYVIPMTSTQHTVSRAWMFNMNGRRDPRGNAPPSYAMLYRLKTKYRSNAAGSWFVWDPEYIALVDNMQDYNEGKMLFDTFNTGERKAAYESEEDLTQGDDGHTQHEQGDHEELP